MAKKKTEEQPAVEETPVVVADGATDDPAAPAAGTEEAAPAGAEGAADDATADPAAVDDSAAEVAEVAEEAPVEAPKYFVHPVTGQDLADPTRPFNADNPVAAAVVH